MSETSLPWLKHYPEGFPAEINPDRFASIPALFDTIAETYGDHPAFICMDKVLTSAVSRRTLRATCSRFPA